MIEIEAKFVLPDPETFQRLQAAELLAGYTLAASRVERLHDTFLDTAGRHIQAAGYYLRQRSYEGEAGIHVTLKALPGPPGAVHRREELTLVLPAEQPPAQWPAGTLRDQVLAYSEASPLRPLLELDQTRLVRPVYDGERLVAELSLDTVYVRAGKGQQAYYDLEVELAAPGSEQDLAAIAAALGDSWGLAAQPLSKFERALAFLEEAPAQEGLLRPAERAVCRQVATRNDLHGRRAQVLLALDEGARQIEAGRRARMSVRRVRYWLAEFRHKRLGIFPPRVLAQAEPAAEPSQQTAPAPALPQAVAPPALPAETPAPAPAPGPRPPNRSGLQLDDTMALAAGKTLFLHFQHMLYHEPGTRLGQDIEELHDMRVATRRMRAAVRLFADYLDPQQIAPLGRGLRRAGRLLGAVRDLDVFREKAQHYLDLLPQEQHGSLDLLMAAWTTQHAQDRQRLQDYLDGERYAHLKERMEEFLRAPGLERPPAAAEGPRPQRLRQVVPVALYQGLAAVRVYEEWLVGPDVPLVRYHQLRIAGKRLRYALEFFREVLGPEDGELIERMKALQDHLGDLQDAVVACGLLRDFLTWGTWGHPPEGAPWPAAPVVAPGVAAYLAFRQLEIQHLLETFSPVWEQVRGSDFSRLLAASVAALF